MKNILLKSLAVAAMFGAATTAFAGDIPGAADAKAGDIGRHETASDVNEWVNPDNGVYGIHIFAADANDWDSQFFIVFADANVPAGTPIDVKFEYRKAEGSGVVKFNAQGHADPHAYVNNDGWATLEATEEWQTYEGSFEASGEIRTLAVNASIGREDGTLYMRNIVISVNYDDVVVTKETTEDEADLGEAPHISVPEPEPEPEIAGPATTVDYAKIGEAAADLVWSKQDEAGAKTLPNAAKYGDDVVLAFAVSTEAVNHWDVAFHVDFTSISSTLTDKAVLSFEYKDDYAVGGNMWWHNGGNARHDGLMPWDGDAQIARGLDWLKFEDTLVPTDSLYQWEIQLGPDGKNPAEAFNVFVKNLKLTIDGKEVYSLASAASPVEGAIKENGAVTPAINEATAIKAYFAGNVLYASEATDMVIYNINGVAVKSVKNAASLNVSDLKSGLYIAKVGNKTVKFVK